MLELRDSTPFGKDYGFNWLVTRVLPSSQSLQPLPNAIGLQDYSWSNKICRKVSFECSIAYQLIQDYSWLVTVLRPKRLRWVKGNYGPQHRRSLENNNVKHDYSSQHKITSKIPSLSGVITWTKTQDYSWNGTLIIPPSYLTVPSSPG